jgi:capsular exopolysaccharide synthesis family protein
MVETGRLALGRTNVAGRHGGPADTGSVEDHMELRHLIGVVRARIWVIVASVTLFMIAGAATSALMPKSYEAQALLEITDSQPSSDLFSDASQRELPRTTLETQVELIQRRLLTASVAETLGVTRQNLQNNVSVTAVPDTNIISISVTDESPVRAAAIANSIGDAYLTWTRQRRLAGLNAAIDEMQARLKDASSSFSGPGDTAKNAIAGSAYTLLAERLEELRVNQRLESGIGHLAVPAEPPTVQSSPRPFANLAFGFAFGLLFGVAAAFAAEYQDNRIKSVTEAEEIFGAPILGRIAEHVLKRGATSRVVVLDEPASRVAESYRMLRNALSALKGSDPSRQLKAVMVTSAFANEGKSTVAANLAATMAQAGYRVVLVSCDFRHPTLSEFFELPLDAGLSNVLNGDRSLESTLQISIVRDRLALLGPGKPPANPSELLGSVAMQGTMRDLSRDADWVFLDTPPLLAFADATAVAPWVDGVLMVTREGVSTRTASHLAMEILRNVGAKVVGVVALASEKQHGGYGYGYGYDSYASGAMAVAEGEAEIPY